MLSLSCPSQRPPQIKAQVVKYSVCRKSSIRSLPNEVLQLSMGEGLSVPLVGSAEVLGIAATIAIADPEKR